MKLPGIRRLRWALADLKSQTGLRRFVPAHKGLDQHGLTAYQVYPQGGNLGQDFFTQPREQFDRFINRETAIASMGSCFAVEIQAHLMSRKFNYIRTEESWAGSAEWGRVYTTKNMLQIFQYSFSDFSPEIRLGRTETGVFDPYREVGLYATEEAAETGIKKHVEKSRAALEACKVLVITVGQNEAWVNKNDGAAWALKPPPKVMETYGADRFELKQFSVDENIEYLNGALDLFWQNNSDAKVILTLSPVPSWATFYDVNMAVRSFENKANLLVAVKAVVKRYSEKCFYFPSFEMALLSRNPNLQLDNRHPRPKW